MQMSSRGMNLDNVRPGQRVAWINTMGQRETGTVLIPGDTGYVKVQPEPTFVAARDLVLLEDLAAPAAPEPAIAPRKPQQPKLKKLTPAGARASGRGSARSRPTG